MKIIDRNKDYYDYLQGVYGIDTQAVFDSTYFPRPSTLQEAADDHLLCEDAYPHFQRSGLYEYQKHTVDATLAQHQYGK
jgi:hypothetical protein